MKHNLNRQIVLDTETTGLLLKDKHRIIEIGCVEIVNRNITGKTFHQYINPERNNDPGAYAIHGISNKFLQDKPKFKQIAPDFIEFIKGAELIIHNAPFDVGFLNYELSLLPQITNLTDICTITDSLGLAKSLYPGTSNSLSKLCSRFGIDDSHRELHGALLDAELLAEVYLIITSAQIELDLKNITYKIDSKITEQINHLPVIKATSQELDAHNKLMKHISN